jgi:hypothetical protein
MPQPEQMLAAHPQLAGEFGRGHPLGDAAKDQEDLGGAVMCPLPGGVREHVEDPTAALAAVIDDRRIGAAAVDVNTVPGATTGAGEPLGVEQIEEPPSAPLLVHQLGDRKIHEVGSGEMKSSRPDGQENRSGGG